MSGRPLLSASLIVRDEAAHLADCLTSLAGVVDEIVVVDTGSIDDTVAIAEAHGAALIRMPWRNDFSAARNRALEAASGAWILYIDADERLGDCAGLRAALGADEARDAVAAVVRFHAASSWTPYLEHRLFRNRPDLRFHGAIHETIVPDIRRIVAEEGASVIEVPAAIVHLGYEGDIEHKHRRNLPLLEEQVRLDPERTYLWFDLGLARRALGDDTGAEQAWAAGAAAAMGRPTLEPVDLLVLNELAMCRLRRAEDASELARAMASAFPDDPLTIWVAAQVAMADGRWADAEALLRPLAALDADEVRHEVLAYNRGLFGPWAHQALGSCAFHQGDDEAAARWFGLAAAADPGNEEYETKRRLAEARAAARSGSPG